MSDAVQAIVALSFILYCIIGFAIGASWPVWVYLMS